MANTFDTDGRLEERDPLRSAELLTNLSSLRSLAACQYILIGAIACLFGLWSATVAHSQEILSADPSSPAAKFPSGKSTYPGVESTSPPVVVGMAEPTRFKVSNTLQAPPTPPTTDRYSQENEASGARLTKSGLPGGGIIKPGHLANRIATPPSPPLALLQPEYSRWESSLADSRSLAEVDAVTVHPLFQIDRASWHLPVTLYIPPQRDGDVR